MSDLTTAGTLLVEDALPDRMRGRARNLDKKELQKIFDELVTGDPEEYKRVLGALSDVGKRAAWTEGTSVSLAALRRGQRGSQAVDEARRRVQEIIDDDNLSDDDRRKLLIDELVPRYKQISDAVMEDAKDSRNPFYMQVKSGARGNASSLNSMAGADLLTTGPTGDLVPVPLMHSYAEGFTPAEYFAASYGQRRGMLDSKTSVARAGFLSKKLANATHRQVVTRETPIETRLPVGYATLSSDKDNVGAVLAADAGPIPKGTILSSDHLKDLQDAGIDDILVYSPMTDFDEDGGISAYAAGRRASTGLPVIGDNIGLPAAQAIGERLSQGLLCLAQGTKVKMSDFSERAIEELRAGDWVIGSDSKGNTFPVRVVRVFENGTRPCWRYSFSEVHSGPRREVVCTEDHKILAHRNDSSSKGETHDELVLPAGKISKISGAVLPKGFYDESRPLFGVKKDRLAGLLGHKNQPEAYGRWARLREKEFVGELPTFDIEVDHPDHLFVLGSGLIVSNSSKHSGGVSTRVDRSGLDYIERLVEAPETFQQVGPLATEAGVVKKISPAPQGGTFIEIGDTKYHVPDGIGVTVQEGQSVDRGYDLTDAPPHPAQLAATRGVGEARRVYANMLHQALSDSGLQAHRRNIESVAAGLMNHVRITNPDGYGEFMYDDVVPYPVVAASYKPRPSSRLAKPAEAEGAYLEEPVLHYSIGTRMNKKVRKDLEKWGIKDVYVSDDEPDFETEFVPGVRNAAYDPDWSTRLSGFYTSHSFLDAVRRGNESDTMSTSFVPALSAAKPFGANLSALGKYGTAQ